MVSQPSILVLGAGQLGLAVIKALSTHPNHGPITVLLRLASISSPDSTKQAEITRLRSLGISILSGDITSSTEAELASLFSPFHTIIGCTGMTCPPGTQLKLAKAALAARVQRYLPWQFGVDYDAIGRGSSQDLFTEQLDVRDLLRSQKETKWVIVSTGMFMDFVFWPPFGIVSEDYKTVRALGSWENRVAVTTAQDIGRVVAEIVCAAPEIKGVVYTAGETVSYRQLADIVEKVMGHDVEREEKSVQTLEEDLAKDPQNGLKKYAIVFAEGRGVAWDEGKTLNVQRGMELQGVEDWVRTGLKK